MGAPARGRLGMALAGLLLVPGLATLWMAWEKFPAPVPPEAVPLTLAAIGALGVNLTCALVLARHRHHKGSLSRRRSFRRATMCWPMSRSSPPVWSRPSSGPRLGRI